MQQWLDFLDAAKNSASLHSGHLASIALAANGFNIFRRFLHTGNFPKTAITPATVARRFVMQENREDTISPPKNSN